ncbi:MAG: hypothetical protein R3D67_02215 [Hyphomicrobiaceae bacterium]
MLTWAPVREAYMLAGDVSDHILKCTTTDMSTFQAFVVLMC